jgi:hypothetical protein
VDCRNAVLAGSIPSRLCTTGYPTTAQFLLDDWQDGGYGTVQEICSLDQRGAIQCPSVGSGAQYENPKSSWNDPPNARSLFGLNNDHVKHSQLVEVWDHKLLLKRHVSSSRRLPSRSEDGRRAIGVDARVVASSPSWYVFKRYTNYECFNGKRV